MNFRDIEYRFSLMLKFLSNAFSLNEFKMFLKDNRGGLMLSFDEIHIPDKDWLDYKRLEVDQSVKSISPNDLTKEFCPKVCKLVDEFHRKTVNEDIEWMLYFDYTNGEVIYCWKGEKGKLKVILKIFMFVIEKLHQFTIIHKDSTRSLLQTILIFWKMSMRIMK